VPYIARHRREMLWSGSAPENEGELNFAITELLEGFLSRHGTSYGSINAVVGVLECAKQEFYRRIAVPYEESKREENGDVYNQTLKS
jgi:hypothetical protein